MLTADDSHVTARDLRAAIAASEARQDARLRAFGEAMRKSVRESLRVQDHVAHGTVGCAVDAALAQLDAPAAADEARCERHGVVPPEHRCRDYDGPHPRPEPVAQPPCAAHKHPFPCPTCDTPTEYLSAAEAQERSAQPASPSMLPGEPPEPRIVGYSLNGQLYHVQQRDDAGFGELYPNQPALVLRSDYDTMRDYARAMRAEADRLREQFARADSSALTAHARANAAEDRIATLEAEQRSILDLSHPNIRDAESRGRVAGAAAMKERIVTAIRAEAKRQRDGGLIAQPDCWESVADAADALSAQPIAAGAPAQVEGAVRWTLEQTSGGISVRFDATHSVERSACDVIGEQFAALLNGKDRVTLLVIPEKE